jgi:metallo-beta-lactamase family protein
MKLHFLGGNKTVTGSKHLLEAGGSRLLIDCGMFQGQGEEDFNKEPLPIEAKEINAIILTHAHYDHCGYLPKLFRDGCHAPIYCTSLTKQIAEVVLMDSVQIQITEGKETLYDEEDVLKVLSFCHIVDFGESIKIDNLNISLYSAGHIPGASYVIIEAEGKKILFSGDVGNPNDILMSAAAPMPKVDYAIVESTYGDRLHDDKVLDEEIDYFLTETFTKKRVWLIPSFAVARTQNIFYKLFVRLLNLNFDIPIFVNSPMASAVSEIYLKNSHKLKPIEPSFKEAYEYIKFSKWPKELKKLDTIEGPAVIISSSGMLEGGRILRALKHHGRIKGNLLTFVGYQGEGTLGRRILEGEREFSLPDKKNFILAADIHEIKGLSAHADREQLVDWILQHNSSSKIFLVHGDEESQCSLKDFLSSHGVDTETTFHLDAVELT